MRSFIGLAAVLTAAVACAPKIPDSAEGVGFGDYESYRAQIAASDRAVVASTPQAVQPPPRTASATTATSTVATAPITAPGTEVATAGLGSTAGPLLSRNNPGISSEQDFDAVSAERDIAADAARITAARQQYQLVTPTELQRPGDTGPNIINYALTSSHPVGEKKYRRNPFSANRAAQKCAGYRTDDVAQEEFLGAGGPQRDRLGLDPDGDGYACNWNPATYRNLVRN